MVLAELEVRAAQPEERDQVREFLGKEHYLGAGRDVGRTLVQVVHHRGRWVALLTWGQRPCEAGRPGGKHRLDGPAAGATIGAGGSKPAIACDEPAHFALAGIGDG